MTSQSTFVKIKPKKLCNGEIQINGYKHAMVQIIAVSIALNVPVLITNAPLTDDIYILKQIIENCGGFLSIKGQQVLVNPQSMSIIDINANLSKQIHGSIYLMPAFAVRFGKFSFGEGGGCQIGDQKENGRRPISHILSVMSKFSITNQFIDDAIQGKQIQKKNEVIINIMEYSDSSELATGALISGATKTAILCAVQTNKTRILNPYLKADVQDLLRFLIQLGFIVEINPNFIEIIRPNKLITENIIAFELTECISEVITYVALAVHTHIQLNIQLKQVHLLKKLLAPELELLNKIGVRLKFHKNGIHVIGGNQLKNTNIDVLHDGIQSDHHPFFTLMLLQADKKSEIREFVWKNRFSYANELRKLGANLLREENMLHIYPSSISRSNLLLKATDTRAAAVLLLAALTSSDTVSIEGIHHLNRGYSTLINNLEKLGSHLSFSSSLVN
jgi:UDP-N-acetylglucosamine 1-carboxyvinyltransferase